jgi:hypothetical protein
MERRTASKESKRFLKKDSKSAKKNVSLQHDNGHIMPRHEYTQH